MKERWGIFEVEGNDRKCLKSFFRGWSVSRSEKHGEIASKGSPPEVGGGPGCVVIPVCVAGDLSSSSAQLPGARTDGEYSRVHPTSTLPGMRKKRRARELRACKPVVAGGAAASDLNPGRVNRGATHEQGDGAEAWMAPRGRRTVLAGVSAQEEVGTGFVTSKEDV